MDLTTLTPRRVKHHRFDALTPRRVKHHGFDELIPKRVKHYQCSVILLDARTILIIRNLLTKLVHIVYNQCYLPPLRKVPTKPPTTRTQIKPEGIPLPAHYHPSGVTRHLGTILPVIGFA